MTYNTLQHGEAFVTANFHPLVMKQVTSERSRPFKRGNTNGDGELCVCTVSVDVQRLECSGSQDLRLLFGVGQLMNHLL